MTITPAQIAAMARQRGLDPQAVLAVAAQEGLGGGIGDSGTSFGPFQLHYGGAYPSSAPRGSAASHAWAWSPAGVSYALDRIASVAKGLTGQAAVNAIVRQFERPADPDSEVSRAVAAYGGGSTAAYTAPSAASVAAQGLRTTQGVQPPVSSFTATHIGTPPYVQAPELPAPAQVDITPYLKAVKAAAAPHNFGPQARKYANQDVAAAVAGIRAQQDEIRRQYAAQAAQITQAGIDTSKYLQSLNLGGNILNDYKGVAADQLQAATTLSGGLQKAATDEAARVQANLNAIGSSQTAANTGSGAGQVLEGLGGYLPYQTLDNLGLLAKKSLDALPAQTLGYGQTQATGVLGAGAAEAAKLNADIAAEQANRSTIAAKYLGELEDAYRKAGQDRVAATLNALKLQQKDAAAQATAAWHAATLQTGVDKSNQSAYLSTVKANQSADLSTNNANALAGYRAATLGQGQQRIGISAANAATSRARANAALQPKFTASTSRALGYRADQYGAPLGGKVTLLPGFSYDKHGNVVKTSAASKKGTTKQHGLTVSQANRLKGLALTIAQTARTGGEDNKGNVLEPLDYKAAVLEMEKEGIPAWIYIPALNRFFNTPTTGNPYMLGPPAPAKK